MTEPFEGVGSQDRPSQTGQAEGQYPGGKSHTKGQKWAVQHAKAAWGSSNLFGFLSNWQAITKPNRAKISHQLTDLLSQSRFCITSPLVFHLSG
ncbi:hypothetical protein [Aeromonas veronii]|uniref:hypothetical protein n=1 Tax=Aeromonas veronii TaxID=654 RepID=UPI002441AD6D|nr:hypothetical protein [Aeromonas veronii]